LVKKAFLGEGVCEWYCSLKSNVYLPYRRCNYHIVNVALIIYSVFPISAVEGNSILTVFFVGV
jgi:hypothetical protein